MQFGKRNTGEFTLPTGTIPQPQFPVSRITEALGDFFAGSLSIEPDLRPVGNKKNRHVKTNSMGEGGDASRFFY